MRYLFVLIITLVTFFSSCFSPESEVEKVVDNTVTEISRPDSVIFREVNNYIKYVEESFQQRQKLVNIGPVEKEEKVVWLDNDKGELLRVMYAIFRVDTFFRHTYYLKDNEIIYYRYQNWLRTETPNSSSEFMCLLEGGNIIRSGKKYMELEENERPIKLAKLPHIEAKINQDSMLQVINNNWFAINTKKENGGEIQHVNLFPSKN